MIYTVLSSPQKTRHTVPGPVWDPMTVPISTMKTVPFNQKEGLIPRSLLRNKLFQDMEEVIY